MLKREEFAIVVIGLVILTICFPYVNCRSHPHKRKILEGDIDMSRREMNKFQTGVLFTGKVYPVHTWKDGVIPYTIQPQFDSKQKELLIGAMREISGDTCIQFVPRTDERDFIKFVKSNGRCSSKVGKVGKGQDILMSPSCMRHGTVVHELLHTLGLYHEQSRPDRDNFITIVWNNLKSPDSKRNFEKYGTKFWSQHPLPYDYGSIMHYSSEAFAKQWGKKTILPKAEDAPIGQRASMSHFDKVKINMMYNCQIDDE